MARTSLRKRVKHLIQAFPPYRLLRHQAIRKKARQLMPLQYPAVGFAELARACALNGEYISLQYEAEIVRLLEIIHERQCQTLLEIGTCWGGTFFLLTRAASPHATLLTLDLEIDPVRQRCLQAFALDQQRVVCLQGNSHSQASCDKVRTELGGRPLEFLLIDGDHSAEGVRKDFELYRPLLARGGVVAFHDICIPSGANDGVKDYWSRLKGTGRSEEVIADPRQPYGGLGLLYV